MMLSEAQVHGAVELMGVSHILSTPCVSIGGLTYSIETFDNQAFKYSFHSCCVVLRKKNMLNTVTK